LTVPATSGTWQQTGQFFNVFHGRTGMDHTSLIGEFTIRSDQRLSTDSLSKDFDSQNIRNDIFSFAINIGMHKCYMIIARNDIAQGRETFFDTLYDDTVWQRIAQML
jgi:hypothetical protein